MSKFLNLVKDREFQFRAFVLGAFLFLLAWQFLAIGNQKKEIVVLKKEQERKKALLAKNNNKVQNGPLKDYRLQGITSTDGKFQARINGAVYKVGDLIDQYKITEITLRSSTLQNPDTSEIRKLEFGE